MTAFKYAHPNALMSAHKQMKIVLSLFLSVVSTSQSHFTHAHYNDFVHDKNYSRILVRKAI